MLRDAKHYLFVAKPLRQPCIIVVSSLILGDSGMNTACQPVGGRPLFLVQIRLRENGMSHRSSSLFGRSRKRHNSSQGKRHRQPSRKHRQPSRRPVFETLEARNLLAVFYVDGVGGDGLAGGGNDTNEGTSLAAPFRTIDKANSVLTAGDTVLIRGGTYSESIAPNNSGTAGAKITYQGFNGEMPFVQGNVGAGQGNPTQVNNRSYIVVDGFDLSTPIKTYGATVIFRGNNNELRNSLIDNPLTAPGMPESTATSPHNLVGLTVGKSKFNLVENTTITGWWLGLVANDGVEDLTVRGNVIARNVHNQITIGPRQGFGTMNDPNPLRLLFEDNIIGGSLTSDGIQTNASGPGVVNMRGIIIRGNTFYFLGENALDFKSAGDIVVENNTFVASLGDDDGTGVRNSSTGNTTERWMGAIGKGSNQGGGAAIVRNNVLYDNVSAITSSADDWKIYNNTIVANNRDAFGWDSSYTGNPAWTPATFLGARLNYNGNALLNNIIVDNQDGAVIIGDTPTSRVARFDNNLYDDASGNLKFLKGKNATVSDMTFSEWQTYLGLWPNIEGKEQNSLVADPQFVNVPRSASTFPFFNYTEAVVGDPVYAPVLTFDDLATWFPYDFSLQAGSPAIDAGGFLTAATNSGSNSTTLQVGDSRVFTDGYGIVGEGDVIQIGSEAPVLITSINYATDTITLAAARTWANGANVSFPYSGSAPDIGAFEFTSNLVGDFESDGDVDGDDLDLWEIGYGTPSGAALSDGDADGDGDVDGSDFLAWQRNFGATTTPNPSPTAADDSYSTALNTLLSVSVASGVLENDVDADPLTAVLVSGPTEGVLNLQPDGSFTYTPDTGFSGTDSFTYVANDGTSSSDIATVTLGVDLGSYEDTVLALNPVSYWRLGETGGTTAVDQIGVSNGIYRDGVALGQTGAIGGDSDLSAGFDGLDDYIEIANDNAYLLDSGSVSFWFRTDNTSQTGKLVTKDASGFVDGGHFAIGLNNGIIDVRLQNATQSFELFSTSTITPNVWQNVVFNFGSGGMELYLNGQLEASDSYTGGLGTTSGGTGNAEPWVLAAHSGFSDPGVATPLGQFYEGQIDEVALFGTALSLTQVQDLYATGTAGASARSLSRIQPYAGNPFYWQYEGEPLLLLGGSDDDDLHNWTNSQVTAQLDLLVSKGGNFIRDDVTSHDNDSGVYPFVQTSPGMYDLDQWDEAWWSKITFLLSEAQQRDIIVSFEIWNAFTFRNTPWSNSPWNPKNNINYTQVSSGIPEFWGVHPSQGNSPFIETVPGLGSNGVVLPYQEAFVREFIKRTLPYDNALYVIQNESNADFLWSDYWATVMHDEAGLAGEEVEIADMRDPWNLTDPDHEYPIDRPNLYTFIEISQNNQNPFGGTQSSSADQLHYNRVQTIRDNIQYDTTLGGGSPVIRPMNTVKTYGADTNTFDPGSSNQRGTERFWRNVFGGGAAARFHRPNSGLGLGTVAQANILSARMATDAIDVFSAVPDNSLLSNRSNDEAYVLAAGSGEEYAVYFTGDAFGFVQLDVASAPSNWSLRWLDVASSTWGSTTSLGDVETVSLQRPGSGQWVAIVAAGSALELASASAVVENTAVEASTEEAIAIETIPQQLIDAASAYWNAMGADTSKLAHVKIEIADLGGNLLGVAYTGSGTILVDADAAGRGWFVDPTPWNSIASEDERASGVDLLSVLSHEMGHLLGLEHDEDGSVMGETLASGTRSANLADAVFADF